MTVHEPQCQGEGDRYRRSPPPRDCAVQCQRRAGAKLAHACSDKKIRIKTDVVFRVGGVFPYSLSPQWHSRPAQQAHVAVTGITTRAREHLSRSAGQSVSQLFHGPAPRSPLHRLAVRLRHSRSNTSTEYSLPGATQVWSAGGPPRHAVAAPAPAGTLSERKWG